MLLVLVIVTTRVLVLEVVASSKATSLASHCQTDGIHGDTHLNHLAWHLAVSPPAHLLVMYIITKPFVTDPS